MNTLLVVYKFIVKTPTKLTSLFVLANFDIY